MGITNDFWPASPPSHCTTAIYLLSTEMDVMLTSILPATAGHIKTVTHGSLLSLLPHLYQLIPSRDTAWFQKNFITDYRVSPYSLFWTTCHLFSLYTCIKYTGEEACFDIIFWQFLEKLPFFTWFTTDAQFQSTRSPLCHFLTTEMN